MAGFIKIYRQLEDWEWYMDSNTKSLFIHCLLRANHKDNKWRGKFVDAGSFITSYERLSAETGLSVRQVRTSLNRLKSTGELTHKTTSQFSIISIVKWEDYQGYEVKDDKQIDKLSDKRATSERQASDKRATTNKNDKNVKNDKNKNKDGKNVVEFVPPTLEEVTAYAKEKGFENLAKTFFEWYSESEWKDVKGNQVKNWKQKFITWMNREPKYTSKQRVEVKTDYSVIEKTMTEDELKLLKEELKSIK